MIKKLFCIFLIFSSSAAFASEKYVTPKDDGTFLMTVYTGSDKPIEQVIKELGGNSDRTFQIQESKIPKTDSEYWVLDGKRIVVDEDKKHNDLKAKELKESKKKSVLSKLKITEDELKEVISE